MTSDNNIRVVGKLNKQVIDLAGVTLNEGQYIMLGESNIAHMKSSHPNDYDKYGDKISEIISIPDYIAKHPQKDSIEYIKVYDEYVLVAVRVTTNSNLFVRTLFVMSDEKVDRYKEKGAFKEYQKK